ncbi:MAG TPA: hypothetical protein VLK58_28395 [Conexibacter sp.]|nr:hypothetical protein [Conexibacter sp.]
MGDVLRAREAEAGDAYATVKVVAIHRTINDTHEAIIQPFPGFGQSVSAAMTGEGSILRHFDVLSAAEVAELTPAAEDAPEQSITDVAAAKAELAAARTEGK